MPYSGLTCLRAVSRAFRRKLVQSLGKGVVEFALALALWLWLRLRLALALGLALAALAFAALAFAVL